MRALLEFTNLVAPFLTEGLNALKSNRIRTLAGLAAVALSLAVVTPTAQAATATVGKACSKVGAKAVDAKKKALVCTKVGAKLVWRAAAVPPKVTTPFSVEVISDLTGSGVGLAAPYADGVTTYFDWVNDRGGVNGRTIKYNVSNTQSDVTTSQTVVRQAIAAKPVAILAANGSGTLAAIFPILEAEKQVVISANSLGYPLYDWFYQAVLTADQLASSLTNSAAAVLGRNGLNGKKVALVGIDSPSTRATLEVINGKIRAAGGTVTSTQFVAPAATSFDVGAVNILSENPDVVIVQHSAPGTVLVSKALGTAGFNKSIVVNYGGSDDISLQSIANGKLFGLRPYPYVTVGTAVYKAAVKSGSSATALNEGFTRGWLMAGMLVEALKKCTAVCATADLKKALDGLSSFTVEGDILTKVSFSLSKTNHVPLNSVSLYSYDQASRRIVEVLDGVPAGGPNYPATR